MIKVNKRYLEWEKGMNVQKLLDICKYTFPMILVRINGENIPKSEYKNREINDNDEIDIIHLVAGG